MLESLQFVKGAVARKDFAPILTHFGIADGRIIGYNGVLALSGPIALDLVANPKAGPFIAAINSSKDSLQITQLPNGNLSVRSGGFRVTVECDPSPFPTIPIGGDKIALEVPILPALKKLAPFISEDASRPWSRGILLRGNSAYATNNVCIVQYWLGCPIQNEFAIPSDAVVEMLRIGEEPESITTKSDSMTVFYKNDRWLHISLTEGKWPNLDNILDSHTIGKIPSPIPKNLFEAMDLIKGFLPKEGTFYLRPEKITTNLQDDDDGAECDVPGFQASGKYAWKYLSLMRDVATSLDFEEIPGSFFGDKVRGIISGWKE